MEYTTKTIKREGITINIHRPILTEKERTAQEKRIVETLNKVQILKEGG